MKNQPKGKPTRFIRMRGRIVPIYGKSDYVKDPYKTSAKAGLVGGVLSGAGLSMQFSNAKKAAVFGAAASLGAIGYGGYKTFNQFRAAKQLGSKKEGGGVSGFIGQNLMSGATASAGIGLGFGLAAGTILGGRSIGKQIKALKYTIRRSKFKVVK